MLERFKNLVVVIVAFNVLHCQVHGVNVDDVSHYEIVEPLQISKHFRSRRDLSKRFIKGFENPVCGDGFLGGDEECDCGTQQDCKISGADQCCNPSTCRLRKHAQCAEGTCCKNCTILSQGTLCRKKYDDACDLEEYCDGESGYCPRNFYARNGRSCESDQGYCYEGVCRTHTHQCETLWGPYGAKAEDGCFANFNSRGNEYGNCGEDEHGLHTSCNKTDVLCGKIQCQAKPGSTLPTWPRLGSNRVIKRVTFYVRNGKFTCRALKMSFPKELKDPTLTLDGTKCAENSICLNRKCTNLLDLPSTRNCSSMECKNGGICNNNGHCHCPDGFACPDCAQPGIGGSLDSGQGCYVQPTTTTTTNTTTTNTTTTTTPASRASTT